MAPLLALNFRNLDRTQRPRPAQYDLVIEWGHTSEVVTPDSWRVHSPATGPARISLVPRIPTPVLQVPADLSGTIGLSTLVDHEAVRRVEYRLSGHGFFYDFALGASTAGPRSRWILRWDSTSVPNGDYSLTSIAFDATGRGTRSNWWRRPAVAAAARPAVAGPVPGGGGGSSTGGGGGSSTGGGGGSSTGSGGGSSTGGGGGSSTGGGGGSSTGGGGGSSTGSGGGSSTGGGGGSSTGSGGGSSTGSGSGGNSTGAVAAAARPER